MSPPAATAARRTARAPARRATRRGATRVAPRVPRRVSGPLRPAPASQPLGVRLAAFASTLPDRGIVDRLVRGRAWIAVVGTLLIGLVAMQVSLLKLNAAIGGDVERTTALERTNGELRAQVSQLESGERIQEEAASLGMVMPPAGQISYLSAGGAGTAGAAAEALRQQGFNDPTKAHPLPGTADVSPGDTSATGEDTSSTDGSATDTSSSDTSSTDSSSTDTSSGEADAADTSSSSDSASGDTSSSEGTSSTEAAAAGGTASDQGTTQ
jgi:hypothetical protein